MVIPAPSGARARHSSTNAIPRMAPLPVTLLAMLQIVDQPLTPTELVAIAARMLLGLAVAYVVYRFVRRLPWPRPFRFRFLLVHLAAAPASGVAWLLLTSVAVVLITGRPFIPTLRDVPVDFLSIGSTVYLVIAAVTYLDDATARAARAEGAVARTQLATLRAQLQPHFLFNALHTVVQLIPIDPARASHAAELVASLLRRTLEEERDEVTLDDEWGFVSRYLEVERIRFGERLLVRAEIGPELLDERVPAFSLQTLVENAVRHGAAHRVAPTEIVVAAGATGSELTLSVRNTGDRLPPDPVKNGKGTGLPRLLERLALLYGDKARLTYGAREEGGFEAVLVVPRDRRRS